MPITPQTGSLFQADPHTVVPQPRRIPVVLSVEEVSLLLHAASAPK